MQEDKSTLLLRFAAPLQAWGSSSRFNVRMTEREPTKSAVIGLLAAAMGLRREDPLGSLAAINFGVRIDQVGKILHDFHTAQNRVKKQAFVSDRHYIADAVFLVGIEAERESLEVFESAIKRPAFPLYLGRRSCPPADIVSLGIRGGLLLEEALIQEPWQAKEWYQKKQGKTVFLETVVDAGYGDKGAFLRSDMPVSFDQSYRKYSNRSVVSNVKAVSIDNPNSKSFRKETTHDAMGAF